MNSKLFIFLLIVIFVTAWYFFVAPVFRDIDMVRKNIASQEKEIRLSKSEVAQIKSFSQKLEGLTSEKLRLNTALPPEPKTEELMVEYEALVIKSGMNLKSISISPIEAKHFLSSHNKKKKQAKKEETQAQKIAIKLNVSGTYDELKRLLMLSQRDLRLTDFQRISFSARSNKKTETGLPLYDFSLTGFTYYY